MKRNICKTLVAFAALVGLIFLAGENVLMAKDNDNLGQVKKELREYFQNLTDQREFNGSVLVAKDGKVILADGFGFADYQTGKGNTQETVFAIASMSKAFTAMCILMLEERGLLKLDDKVSNYVPELAYGEQVTIKQALNMSAGLADFLGPTEVWTKISEYHTPEQLLPYFEDLPLMFEPGTDWAYCNSCYVVLGLIIERVSGMTYRDFLQVNILEPQNMTSTGYDPYDQEFASQKAVGYDSVLSLPPSQSILLSASIAFAAGGIFSTVKDLYKWDRQLYKDNLISKKSLEKIFTPGLGNYGFGWYIENLNVCGVERKFAWHWGSYLGYHSFIARFPEDDVFIVILENYTSPDLRNSAVLLPTVQAAAEIAFKYNHNK